MILSKVAFHGEYETGHVNIQTNAFTTDSITIAVYSSYKIGNIGVVAFCIGI